MNLYVIATPHQLLNALEARYYFELQDNYIIIVLSRTYPEEAFRPLLNDHIWDHIKFVKQKYTIKNINYKKRKQNLSVRLFSVLNENSRRKQLDAIAEILPEVHNLILGNYDMNFMKHFANRIRYKKLIALDDGTATLRVFENREKNAAGIVGKRIKSNLRERLLGLDTMEADSITFFTTYNLKPVNGDVVINNDFRYLKLSSFRIKPNNKVYFLGQQFVEMQQLDEDVYIEYLKKINKYYENEDLIYIAHKHEASKKLERIKKEVGLEIRRFDVPIEYQMSIRGDKPKILAGFSSSAIETCDHIFSGVVTINVFKIRTEHILNRKDFILNIYTYYNKKRRDDFVVIPL